MKKLWSSESIYQEQSQSSLFINKSPSFKLSQNAGSSSSVSFQSVFYPGRVQYGGAMSATQPYMSSPYVVPEHEKLRNKTGKLNNSINKKVYATLSSTARKILLTLGKMPTHFRDMKMVNKSQGKQCRGTTTIADPQVAIKVNSFSKGVLCRQMSLQSQPKVLKVLIPSTGASNDESGSSKSFESSVVHKGHPAVIASHSSIVAVDLKESTEFTSERKRSSMQESTIQYLIDDDKDIEEADLLNVSSTISPLPKIKHYNPVRTSTPAFPKITPSKKSHKKKQSNSNFDPMYTFSPPAKIPSRNRNTVIGKKAHSNSPTSKKVKARKHVRRGSKNSQARIKLRKQLRKTLKQYSAPILKCYGTDNDKRCDACPRTVKYTQSLVDKTVVGEETSTLSKPLSMPTFAKPKDTRQCSVCTVENSNNSTKCTADHSSKIETNKMQSIFSNNSNKWTCNVCLVKNGQTRLSCEACQAPKPCEELVEEEQTATHLPPWECHVCMAWNENTEKCKACKTPMPGLKPLGKVKSTESAKWQCNTCLVFNDANVKKCVACETMKPGSKQSPSLMHVSSTDKFTTNLGTFGSFTNEKFILFGSATRRPSSPDKDQLFSFGASKRKAGIANENQSDAAVKEHSLTLQGKNSKKIKSCSTCLVESDHNEVNSIPCETITLDSISNEKKTRSTVSTLASSKSKFHDQKSGSNWECQVCLVSNDKERTRCIACESPQPRSENDLTNVEKKSSFKFGSTSSSVFQFGIQNTEKAKLSPSPKHMDSAAATTGLNAIRQKTVAIDPFLVSFLPSSTSHAFSSSALKLERTLPSSSNLLVESNAFKAASSSGTDSQTKTKSTPSVEKTPVTFSSVSGTSGFSVAKLDENNMSSIARERQANTDGNSGLSSYNNSKSLDSTVKTSVNQVPFSSSHPSSKEAKPATGFRFQFPETQVQPSPFSFTFQSTSSAFPSHPFSGATTTEGSASQDLKTIAGTKDGQFTGFAGVGKHKFDQSTTQSGFTTFGMHKAKVFAKESNSLPNPQFSFKSAANNSSLTENSSSFGRSSAASKQSQASIFGANNLKYSAQTQNMASFQSAQKKNFSFGSSSRGTPKPSGIFQFGAPQTGQPTTHAHGFSLENTKSKTNNLAPSAGFNFSSSVQNLGQSKFSGKLFQFNLNDKIQQKFQDSTGTFQFSAGSNQHSSNGHDLSKSTTMSAMFNVGRGNDSKKSSIHDREIKQARRRLRQNKN